MGLYFVSLLVNCFVFCTSKKKVFDATCILYLKNVHVNAEISLTVGEMSKVLVSIKQIVSIRGYYLAEIPAKPGLSEGSVSEIKRAALMRANSNGDTSINLHQKTEEM